MKLINKLIVTACLSLMAFSSYAERIKDITSILGVRSNQLVGYGLVVGLDGTGDKAPFTNQTFKNMMAEFGITLPAGVDPKLKNVAAVTVTADLPPFAKPGQLIDITVASMGNAKSLRGGNLLFTPLRGADGNVYAVGQGNLVVGGFNAEGNDGSRIAVNSSSVGRIPNGATVEQVVPNSFDKGDSIVFNLDHPNFSTARAMVEKINELMGPGTAEALDATSVRVTAPRDSSQRVSYLAIIENLEIEMGKERAKVIINSRTGTIVMGSNVLIDPVAVTHGGLVVTISEDLAVSQPNPFGEGETVVVPQSTLAVDDGSGSQMFKFDPGVSLDSIVKAVNDVGASPSDLMSILEALKQAGALKAELIVI